MRCQSQCRSAVACGAFGYCRERNMAHGAVDDAMQAEWRYLDSYAVRCIDDRWFVLGGDDPMEFATYEDAEAWRP